jgi:hypothetical protein
MAWIQNQASIQPIGSRQFGQGSFGGLDIGSLRKRLTDAGKIAPVPVTGEIAPRLSPSLIPAQTAAPQVPSQGAQYSIQPIGNTYGQGFQSSASPLVGEIALREMAKRAAARKAMSGPYGSSVQPANGSSSLVPQTNPSTYRLY